ncbi:uncharacterized protein LOC105847411 [Hydra vulgaris]|uniref:Uncharacterized protein LOC105847411 n=1 Tax=Hydra vulgaris TaxID=6087 RepID=A0ABM4DJ77_HYDVU
MDSKLVSILVNNLYTEWKIFAYGTGMNLHIIEYIDLGEGNDQTKMQKFLTELVDRNANNYIALVEKSLNDLEKIHVLNEIKTFFAIKQLKLHYIKTYGAFQPTNHKQEKSYQVSHKQENKERSNHNQTNNFFTNHFDLVQVNESECKNDDCNEWQDFINKRRVYKTVAFENIFKQEKPLLLISGVAGIGKTYFLKKCLLLWANGLIWENTDFVFYFSLKKMNDCQNISCINKLIYNFYGNILKMIRQEISSQWSITVILDGLDKFIHIKSLLYYKLGKSCNIPIVNTLNNIINSSEIKCVLAGRTQAIGTYWNSNKTKENIIEIMGLSNQGMQFYMENNLVTISLKNDLNEISSSSFEAKLLLSVPLYLKAVCSSLLNLMIQTVKTLSELQMLIFYYFLQRKCLSINVSLFELMQFNDLYILEISKVAYILLEKGKLTALSNELEAVLDNQGLEWIGFIKKSNLTQKYEFTHFILMRFCASVYLYLCGNPQTVFENKWLKTCLPIVCGIGYGRRLNVLNLISNLKEPVQGNILLQKILEYNDRKLFVQSFFESQTTFNDLKISMDVIKKWNEANPAVEYADIIAEKYFTKKIEEHDKELEYNSLKTLFEKISKKTTKSFEEASCLYDKQQFENAKEIFTEVESIQKEVLGEKHRDALKTKYWIAMCLYKEEQIDIAEKLFREAENIQKYVLGEKHQETLKTQFWIAMCLYDRHQLDDAEKLFREIENIQREDYGEKHEDAVKSKYWIAMCLYYKQQFHHAEKIFKEVEIMQNDIFGEKHANTLNTKYGIARCLYDQKNFDDAEQIFRKVENIQKEVLGEKHEDTLYTRYWIALCLYDKKEFELADKIFSEVENTRKEILKEEGTKVLNTTNADALNTELRKTNSQCSLM